jgi:hypothetical protein
VTDYKKGPADPVDPPGESVRTRSQRAANAYDRITYDYGSGGFVHVRDHAQGRHDPRHLQFLQHRHRSGHTVTVQAGTSSAGSSRFTRRTRSRVARRSGVAARRRRDSRLSFRGVFARLGR